MIKRLACLLLVGAGLLGCVDEGAIVTADGTVATPLACASCHEPQWQAAVLPSHSALGMSKDCAACHGKDSWRPAQGFDHGLVFPLTGKHLQVSCQGCHKSSQSPPTACVGCHLTQFQATTQPNHAAHGYPTDCQKCHSTDGWKPAQGFDHALVWPLVGKHASAPCAGCHVPGQTPSKECVACHKPAYDKATNPNHVALGLPLGCATCHTPHGWQPAKMANHSFPITTGKHKNLQCGQCHQQPSDFKQFTCMSGNCHPKGETDGHHDEEPGYQYSAPKCLFCHPNGKEED